MDLIPMFTTPLGVEIFEDLDNDSIIESCKKHLIYGDQGAHSLRNSLDLDSYPFKSLVDRVIESANRFHKQCGFKYSLKIGSSWCNYSNHYDICRSHTHANCHLIAVYYPQDSDVKIVFNNPIGCIENIIPPDIVETYNEVNQPHMWIYPRKGMLIIHPSWISHYVINKQSERYSVAFDLIIDRG
tara:strand:- start:51 stop:605 length:555 start_codon:yes stop_codon:yes gene_type:complete